MECLRLKSLISFSKVLFPLFKGLIYIFLVYSVFSCTSLRSIEIETAVSPEYPIADDIQSLVLLNRGMNTKFSNIQADSLEKIFVKEKMDIDTVFRDSTAADTVIHVVANALFNSGRFDVVIPEAHLITRNDTDNVLIPLNINIINEYCKDFNVDGVLVLESFDERLTTKYFYKVFGSPSDEVYNASTDINFESEWRLYRPQENKPAIRFQVGDSIFWKANSYSLNDLYVQMPHTKEALIGGGIASGLKMAGYISPNWVKHTRYYFLTGKSEIDAAVALIRDNKWEEAAAIWAKYSTVNSKRLRSKVEFNLALAAEMNGNLDLAIEWGLKSFKSTYSNAVEEYLKILDSNRKVKQRESKVRY